jgi:hypothetical protein
MHGKIRNVLNVLFHNDMKLSEGNLETCLHGNKYPKESSKIMDV